MRISRGVAALACAAGLVVASPAVAAQRTITDPAGDTSGPVDLRESEWRVEGGTATFRVLWGVAGQQTEAFIEGNAWLDLDGDAKADRSLLFVRDGEQIAWELYTVTGGTPGCQPRTGALEVEGRSDIAPKAELEEWQVSFPAAAIGNATSFRWAVMAFAQNVQQGPVFWDYAPDLASGGGTEPDDRRCGGAQDNHLKADLAHGAAFPGDQPPVQTPVPTVAAPPSPQPPTASVVLAEPAPRAGSPAVFDASASRAPGSTIESFEWDFDGDGRYEANTGRLPSAVFLYPSGGTKTVGVKVTNSAGQQATSKVSFGVGGPEPGCDPKLDLGGLRITAACVKREGDRYVITTDLKRRIMMLNGIALAGASELALDVRKGTLSSESSVAVRFLNTPLGDITIWRAASGKFSWKVPVPASLDRPFGSAAKHSKSPGFRLATFGAGGGCKPGERTACATLPGGFPLTGQVDVFINTKTLEAIFDVHAVLDLKGILKVNGDLLLRASREVGGLKLDSLRFKMENARLGIFDLELLDFRYDAPGTVPGLPQGRWSVDLRVFLPTPNRPGVAGRVVFVGGRFNEGQAELKGAAIPIGPGLLLDRFKGGMRVEPIMITGGLGVSILTAVRVDGDFLYERTSAGFAHVGASGSFSFLGHRLADAYFDYFSNGFVGFGGNFQFDSPALSVHGNVGAWFEGDRYQAEGSVNFRVWVINGGAHVLVNNRYLVGCGSVKTWAGRVSGYAAWDRAAGRIRGWFGCDLGAYRSHPTRNNPTASASQAGVTSFEVASGTRALGLSVRGRGGSPVVRITGPDGTTFTTPATPGEVTGVAGKAMAAQFAENQEVVVRLDRPAAGTWRIEPQPGSPPVERLESAQPLPPRPITARVVGRGAVRTLVYRTRLGRGQRIRLVARGRDSAQELGVLTRTRGRLRFVVQEGADRRRRIEATLEDGEGAPRATTTIARFRAPAPARPGRIRRVTVRRRGGDAVVTWTPALRATRYSVEVRGSDGRRTLFLRSPRRRRVVVPRVLAFERLTVRVRGERGPAGRPGPVRTARLKRR